MAIRFINAKKISPQFINQHKPSFTYDTRSYTIEKAKCFWSANSTIFRMEITNTWKRYRYISIDYNIMLPQNNRMLPPTHNIQSNRSWSNSQIHGISQNSCKWTQYAICAYHAWYWCCGQHIQILAEQQWHLHTVVKFYTIIFSISNFLK